MEEKVGHDTVFGIWNGEAFFAIGKLDGDR